MQLQSTPPGSIDGVALIWVQPLIAIDGIPGDIPIGPAGLLATSIDWRWFQVGFNQGNVNFPFYGGELTALSLVSGPDTQPPAVVPEPGTLALLALGLAGLGYSRRKQ